MQPKPIYQDITHCQTDIELAEVEHEYNFLWGVTTILQWRYWEVIKNTDRYFVVSLCVRSPRAMPERDQDRRKERKKRKGKEYILL